MSYLRNSVHFQPDAASTRIELVASLLTASFFFELDALPEYHSGNFRCDGRICLRNHSYGVVQALAKTIPGRLEFWNDDGYLAAFDGIKRVRIDCVESPHAFIFLYAFFLSRHEGRLGATTYKETSSYVVRELDG